eukprot:COSAG05_NODE_515_length_9075_cov_121.644719_6_plen_161_part_00
MAHRRGVGPRCAGVVVVPPRRLACFLDLRGRRNRLFALRLFRYSMQPGSLHYGAYRRLYCFLARDLMLKHASLFGYSNLRATPRVGHHNTHLITMPFRIFSDFCGTGELEDLESCLVRRESAEICDSFTLSYSTRQVAGDAASYGTRGAPRTRFSHRPTP